MKALKVRQGMSTDEEKFIKKSLYDFNLKTEPPQEDYAYKKMDLVLEDSSHCIYGGLIGRIYRSCLYVEILWVNDDYRGQGYGHRLIDHAEAIARQEACTFIHLDTFSFQAPDFYQRHGFEIFGQLDYASGIKRYFLKKNL